MSKNRWEIARLQNENKVSPYESGEKMSTKKQVYVWDGTDCKLEWIKDDFPNLDIFKVETGMLIQSKVNLTYLYRNDFSMWVKLGEAIVSSENGTPILLSESDFEKYVMKEYGVYYVHDKALECIIKQQSGQDTKNNMMQPVQAPVIPKAENVMAIRRMPVYEWDGTPSKFLELKNAFPNMYINYYEGRATSSNKNLSLSESPSFHEVLKVGDKITSLFGKNPLKLTEDEVKYYVNKEDSSFYIYNNVLERIIQLRKENSTIQEDEKESPIKVGALSDETKKKSELLRKEFKEKDEINLPISKWVGVNKKSMEFMFPDAQIDIFFETLIVTIEDKQYKFPKNTIIYVDKDGNPKEMLEAGLENVFMVQKDSFFYIVEDSVFV